MGSPSAVWIPPPSGSMKLNFDAGWAGPRGPGFGLIVRDEKETFHIVASHYDDHRLDPLVAEAFFVSNGQQLVKAFHQCHSFPSLQQILLDREHLFSSFNCCYFHFECRQTNIIAHIIVAESYLYHDCTLWGDPPVGILLHLVANFPDL